ncbi:hypothetical protein BCY91_13470 [Pelobium manganitolerans]|uniref:Calcineurin-like phosphoesterase domain-containing protein n=1 Tax=Pelobium manganitolerans TaxID=1842495 RepID=A0A419SAY9_9SPHI|nr:metallophosphoesterase [Pelobium manganitolerans]RKD19599.1 hypothetical protein BCY91_13470 [Pelobium manganitolerans]
MTKHLTILLFTVIFFSSCLDLEYSPNQAFDRNSPTDLNAINLAKLAKLDANSNNDTVRFILTGDTQRSYDQARDLIRIANRDYPELDFVLLNGDISDFGLRQEMEWVTKIYEDLRVPYITVIGNHDLVANSLNAYRHMFGELNFSFVYKNVKFICQDDNGREYHFNGEVPDLDWLAKELQTDNSVSAIVNIAHIPPSSGDFDRNLQQPYENLLNSNPKVVASLHSHENRQNVEYPTPNGVPFITSNAVTNREFLYVEIAKGKMLKYETIIY